MMQLAHRLFGTVVEGSIASASLAWGSLPLPTDTPHVYAMGPTPDRILLFGAGGVAGIGVTSNELGLGGQLARTLSAMTGRGTNVEIDGVTGRSLVRAGRDLAAKDLSRFDALVIIVGAREAVGLRSTALWRREVEALVQQVQATAPATLSVLFLGIPPLPASVTLPRAAQGIVRRHSEQLDAASRGVCAGSRVRFVGFAPDEEDQERERSGASFYAAWAAPIAVALRGVLDGVHPEAQANDVDEELRLRSLHELVDLTDTSDTRFDGVLAMARDLFGVSGAVLNFLDSERQWTYAGASIPRGVAPRAGSFCDITISQDKLFVVQDTALDPCFAHHANEVDGVRFYAGYPIEAPNGQRIGSLCLIDSVPHVFGAEDASLLRELALRVQATLWSGKPQRQLQH